MHERLTDHRILDAGDEVDPGFQQAHLISVYRGQGRYFKFSRNVFASNRLEMCGEAVVVFLFVFCPIGEDYLK